MKKVGVMTLLEQYQGNNPHIKYMKARVEKGVVKTLSDSDTDYLRRNYDFQPRRINRVVGLSGYFSEQLKIQNNLPFTPNRILVTTVIGQTEKAFHVYAKLTQKQPAATLMWLPKTQVLDDLLFTEKEVEVDFAKYDAILSKYGKTLYQHQKEGIKFLLGRDSSILADDMGLAKTMQSIIAALESGSKKILVICPSSLKLNWKREISVFCEDVAICRGVLWDEAKFTIVNYDILKNFHTIKENDSEIDPRLMNTEIINAKFDHIIIDEAHYLKDHKTMRGKLVNDIVKELGVKKVWLLTGTPVANRPMDYYNLLKLIKDPTADNWVYYATHFCQGRQLTKKVGKTIKKIWKTDGSANLDELRERTKHRFLRRLKTDVLDMPDKVLTPVYYELTDDERKKYEQLYDEYLMARKEQGKSNRGLRREMVEIVLLRQFIALKMIPYTIEFVESVLEEGRKVIIFTTFTEELETLMAHFGKMAVKHNGQMSDKDKQDSVDRFQTEKSVKVFVGNIKSAGVGITLTEGTVEVFNSFDWVPGNNEQAEDRSYRIGQKNDVLVRYQLFDDTISTRMWETLKYKQNIINQILGQRTEEADETEVIIDYILNEDENANN